ncbi:MAG TPA: YCF48-related protein [Candidatus Kapabacteria bacterium]|nr:YCF48-related protein [Candidatus Kapabacteria bacterium]
MTKVTHNIFLFLSLVFAVPAMAQLNIWRSQNPPTSAGDLTALQMINANTTYVVGEATSFIALTDSGRSWTVKTGIAPDKKRRNQTLLGLSFIDSTTGITVGPGLALQTLDAANTWATIAGVSTQYTYTGVLMLSKDIIILIGNAGILMRTVDGGKNWSSFPLELGVDLKSIRKVSDDFIVVTGEGGYLLFTYDSGANWTKKKMPFDNNINGIAFEDNKKAIAVGEGGYVATTIDRGSNWTSLAWDTMGFIVSTPLNAVDTRTPGHYVAVGNYNTLVYSSDGGSHWKKGSLGIFLTTGLNFNGVWMWDKNYGYAVGDLGALIRTTDGGATWDFVPQNPLFARMYGIAFPKGDSSRGIAVGSSGTVLTTSDGGKHWIAAISPDKNASFYGVTFADSNTAFSCGSDGKIYTSTNFGTSWTSVTTPTGRDIFSISFSDHDHGWAAATGNVVLKTINAGVSWQQVQSPTLIDTVTNISFCDPNNGIVGRRRTKDAGVHWDTIASPVSTNDDNAYFYWGYYLKTCMISPKHYVSIATANSDTRKELFGTILTHIGDSSYYFGDQRTTYFINFTAVDFADELHGTVVGTSGTIYQTSDGGKTWNLEPSPTGLQLEAVSMPIANVASASGIRGIILRRTNSLPSSVPSEHSASINSLFSISAAYPNPARENTTLVIDLTRSIPLELRLYDLKGVELKSFDLGMQSEGRFEVPLSLDRLVDGIYIIEVSTPSEARHIQIKVIQ